MISVRSYVLKMALVFASAAVLLAFPYGPLLPWSPVHPGYDEYRLGRGRLLVSHGTIPPEALRYLDEFTDAGERFHGLAATKPVTVVLCRDWDDFQRFVPHIRSRGVGAVTLVTGTVIYITPRVRERGLDLAEFLKHELSHAILHQHQSMLNAFRVGRQQWFTEGLAVSFEEQKSYVTPEEFVNRARRQPLGEVIDPNRMANPLDVRSLTRRGATFSNTSTAAMVASASCDTSRCTSPNRKRTGDGLSRPMASVWDKQSCCLRGVSAWKVGGPIRSS